MELRGRGRRRDVVRRVFLLRIRNPVLLLLVIDRLGNLHEIDVDRVHEVDVWLFESSSRFVLLEHRIQMKRHRHLSCQLIRLSQSLILLLSRMNLVNSFVAVLV